MRVRPFKGDTNRCGCVLVVEEERPTREMLVRWLYDAGYECLAAGNADEAFAVIERVSVDVVISDIRMPGRSDVGLLAELQSIRMRQPVVILTGSDDPSHADHAMSHGVLAYLQKPVEQHVLLFEVSHCMERRRLIDAAEEYTLNLKKPVSAQTRLVRLALGEVIHRLVVSSMVRDDEARHLSERMSRFSAAFAETAGWSTEEVNNMRLAAAMRDLGEIGIPRRPLD